MEICSCHKSNYYNHIVGIRLETIPHINETARWYTTPKMGEGDVWPDWSEEEKFDEWVKIMREKIHIDMKNNSKDAEVCIYCKYDNIRLTFEEFKKFLKFK